jgi:O-antigen/teichoic acid export membrane protein
MGRNRALALFTIGSAVVSIGLAVPFVRSFGLTGAALAVLIATSGESLGVAVPYSMRITGADPRTLLHSSIIPAFLPAIPSLAVLFALRELLQPESLVTVLGVASIGGATYAAVYLALDATAAEREPLRALAVRADRSLRRRSSTDDVAA